MKFQIFSIKPFLFAMKNEVFRFTYLVNLGCFPTRVINSAQDKTMAIADKCLFSVVLSELLFRKSIIQIHSIVTTSIQFSGLKMYLLRLTATCKNSRMAISAVVINRAAQRLFDPKHNIRTIPIKVEFLSGHHKLANGQLGPLFIVQLPSQ